MEGGGNYKVKCLEARYDEENEMLVLNCWFESFSSQRLVTMSRSDFHYKQVGELPPVGEMHKTAAMFKDKEFYLKIYDDPNREKISNEQESFKQFSGKIADEMDKVKDGLGDEREQIKRHLGRLMDEGKIDVKKLMGEEIDIRKKLCEIK